MDCWAGKVAVVTGASSGIGAAIAKALAEKEIIVVGVARREQRIQELANTTNGIIHAKHCDLTEEKQIIELFRWVDMTLGGVDILINNAGVCKIGSLITTATAEWKTMLDINVLALSIATREALVSMKSKNNGHIIHINSITGHAVPKFPQIPLGMYSASKHAVTALTEALRVELEAIKSNVKITSISPGSVYTQMVRDLAKQLSGLAEDGAGLAPQLPYGFMQEKDVVDAVLYALGTRPGVQVHDILIQPIGQAS